MNEELMLDNRFKELADRAYSRGICLFTNFLNLNEQDVFFKNSNNYKFTSYKLFGGAEYSERKILRFGDIETDFPIKCINIKPVLKKFSDTLGHRDFLGALLNLGINREVIGDIIVYDNEAFVFCISPIYDFIIDNLQRVKHTVVKCSLADNIPETLTNNLLSKTYNVASLRLDAIIGEVLKLSRSQSQELIRNKLVFVNSRLNENNSYLVKPEDGITVRGHGKFIFENNINTTKKGRYSIKVGVFQ